MGRVLVLGGNGLVGAETVLRLAAEGHDVTMLNRGTSYWDNDARLRSAVAKHVRCDRDDIASSSSSSSSSSEVAGSGWPAAVREPARFDVVVDLSSYMRRETLSALREFAPRVGLYVYISSDSVYEVCLPAGGESSGDEGAAAGTAAACGSVGGGGSHSDADAAAAAATTAAWRRSVEDDAKRPPPHTDARRRLRRADRYGHGKLCSERELARAAAAHPAMRYLTLRLADVLGPRDNTGRWMQLVAWVVASHVDPGLVPGVHVPGNLAVRPVSLVGAADVAKVVADTVGGRVDAGAMNSAYNLAFDEPVLLRDVVGVIADAVGADVRVTAVPCGQGLTLFPSVERGPVCTDRARRLLGWRPGPLGDALRDAATFYLDAIAEGRREAREAVMELVDDLDLYGGDRVAESLWATVRAHARVRAGGAPP